MKFPAFFAVATAWLFVMLHGSDSWAQTANGPQFWAHRFPGQSQPSLFGYGTPPTRRGPALSFQTSPMDLAVAETVLNLMAPLQHAYPVTQAPGYPAVPGDADPYGGTDPFQGAFGAAPGWSAPLPVAPSSVNPATTPAARPGGVFMP